MARETGSLMPPMHILNAPTRLMRDLGYGKGYVYDHATEEGFSGQNYFPDGVARREFYRPGERGFEREIKKRLEYWDKLRQRAADGDAMTRRRNRDGAARGRAGSARPLVQAALSRPQPRPARKAAAHRADPGRRQARPRRRSGHARARRSGCRRCPRRRADRRRRRSATARPQDVALLRDAVLYRDDSVIVAQQAGGARRAGRHQHRAPCRCAARRAALRQRPNGRASCTGSTRTPRACC